MKWTQCVALAVLMAGGSSVFGAPIIELVDNLDNTVTLQVTPDPSLLPSSLAAETAFSVQGVGVDFTAASIADSLIWDTANPGANPFTGTTTNGLYLNLGANQIFASYGSDVISTPGPTDFLTISYTGSGTILANGEVGQAAVLYENLSSSLAVGGASGGDPTIQFVDNNDGTVTLQIVTTQPGSTGSELAFSVQVGDSLSIDSAMIADTGVFDTLNPGANPFTGTETIGLYTDFPANQVFASVGSDVLGIGTYDFLTLGVSGFGTLEASGLVAQNGGLNGGLSASITLNVPEPTTTVLAGLGLAALAARRRLSPLAA